MASEASAELEAKLLKRRQKCEGAHAPSPPTKKGNRVWSDEMAKTVSQQRRARLTQGDSRLDIVPPSSASSSSSRPKASSSSRRPFFFAAGLVAALCLLGAVVCRQEEVDVNLPNESDFTTDVPEAVETEVKREDVAANDTAKTVEATATTKAEAQPPEMEPAEEEVPFDREHFSAMVKESAIQPHHSSVAADSRAPRDLTEEWQQFLSENPTIGQVYRLGRLTVTESSSRPVRVTVNITLTNLGSSTWPAHAAVQIAHGADLGMDTLPLGRVTSPGEHRKVTLHLKVPRQADAPSCIWALSLDGRVFGVLLLLELDWIESTSAGLLGQATDNLQSARAYVHEVRPQAHDQALLPDLSRVGDVTEEWSADLAPTSVTQAYRIGSIEVASVARGAVLDLVLALENIGQDEWPEGTELKLVSGHSFGFESWDLDTPARSVVQVAMPLKIDHKDAMVEESVWALSLAGHSFGPLLVLELRYNPR
ncbi:unnamed protein product [Cladocopium goreaui]|uniref:Potassium voltage-gated channel subfamily F member 1 n=1 Tax=Cladocopium goreaui TaxID=2562237 RepID=A0A9P1CJ00_9DINO|nr:unnamed protein product [Cladocopium goreaui]